MKPRRTKKRMSVEAIKGLKEAVGECFKVSEENNVGSQKNKTVTCGHTKIETVSNKLNDLAKISSKRTKMILKNELSE